MLSGVELCLVGSRVHEALSNNQIIGTDVAGCGCRDKPRFIYGEQWADTAAVTASTEQRWPPASSVCNSERLWWFISLVTVLYWLFYTIIIFRSAVPVQADVKHKKKLLKQLMKHNKLVFESMSERGIRSSSVAVFSKTSYCTTWTCKCLGTNYLRDIKLEIVVTTEVICEGR